MHAYDSADNVFRNMWITDHYLTDAGVSVSRVAVTELGAHVARQKDIVAMTQTALDNQAMLVCYHTIHKDDEEGFDLTAQSIEDISIYAHAHTDR